MKNLIKTVAFAALVTGLVAPVLSFGQVGGPSALPANPITSYQSAINIINRILNFLFAALVILAVFYVLWAAWDYMTQGDKGPAKGKIINAAIALAIALLARGLPYLVNAILGVEYTPPL